MDRKELKKKYLHDQLLKEAESSDPIISRRAKNRLEGLPEHYTPINITTICASNVDEIAVNCILNFIFKDNNLYDNYQTLPLVLKYIWVYSDFKSELENGGFEQYLSSGGIYFPELIQLSQEFELPAFTLLVKQAIGFFKKHIDEISEFINIKDWNKVSKKIRTNDFVTCDNMDMIDTTFNRISSDIDIAFAKYINTHFDQIKNEITVLNTKVLHIYNITM